uniref:Uncharacterized protein n=1 Tax=viral metagenome TaxID=1070528 RepID=A0A6M3Y0Y6_9ZZZZ
MSWRHEGFKNPYKSREECFEYQAVEPASHDAYEEGYNDCLEAIIPLVKKVAPNSELVNILCPKP